MKKILIFGNQGQLGFDCERVFRPDYLVAGFGREGGDVTNSELIDKIIQEQRPDYIINATAYNKVEEAESEKGLAFALNAKAVENLAKAAKKVSAVFVHVSTDYVFDGSKDFFSEEEQSKPLNTYGESKLAGENFVRQISEKYYLIRTSSLFGAKKSNQKKNFVDQIISRAKEGQTLKVVNDQIMSPTCSYDLALKIKELIEKPAPYGIYHITNQGSCSWYEFAKKILELYGISANLKPISSAELGSKVNRPKKSILLNAALAKNGFTAMPAWQDALKRYLMGKA